MSQKKLALVLSGGGARGAYEAGVIHYIRTQLPESIARKRRFEILCGSSVGAINTCFCAATNHNLDYQGKQILALWQGVRQEDIYRRGVGTMTKMLGQVGSRFFKNVFKMGSSKMSVDPDQGAHLRGVFNTAPFRSFLQRVVPWNQIKVNIDNGLLDAVSITGTNVQSGKVELFIDKHPLIPYTGRHHAHYGSIEPAHAMASTAIPVLFPAVRVGGIYYCDGGLRLNTPLSPALQLGADRVLVVGLHHVSEQAELSDGEDFVGYDVAPTIGKMAGQVLKSVFVDRLDYDLAQLERINRIIKAGEAAYGAEFLQKINAQLSEQEKTKREIKELNVMSIFPSRDVRELFQECVEKGKFMEKELSTLEKFLFRMLDIDVENGLDFLSFVLFIPEYMQKLLDLGYEDAQSKRDELISFLQE